MAAKKKVKFVEFQTRTLRADDQMAAPACSYYGPAIVSAELQWQV